MKVTQVHANCGSYPVYVGQGLMAMPSIWQRHLAGRVMVVTDETVAEHYLDRVGRVLDEDRRWRSLVLPAGEAAKTVANWQRALDELVDMGAQRDATVLALGGGVVGDLAGFAAASYMRGIRVVQMPTTLLAQVDAAVGGKTGVNHSGGKNLIGAFHQPAAVVADIDALVTLDDRDYRAGLAEVVKYGAIRDERFFSWLESRAAALNARMPDACSKPCTHRSATRPRWWPPTSARPASAPCSTSGIPSATRSRRHRLHPLSPRRGGCHRHGAGDAIERTAGQAARGLVRAAGAPARTPGAADATAR